MDKDWIHLHRSSLEYDVGLKKFLNDAFACPGIADKIKCPCRKCNNGYELTRKVVELHLLKFGFETTYTNWTYHGEECCSYSEEEEDELDDTVIEERQSDANTYKMIYDLQRGECETDMNHDFHEVEPEVPNVAAGKFYRLLKNAEEVVFEGFMESKLSFIVKLFQLKCLHGISNIALDALIKLLRNSFPKENKMPESFYEAQKMIRDLGLDYEKIDACVNDCILYRNEYANFHKCPLCDEDRWMKNKVEDVANTCKRKNISRKILRYFPITPRVQRLYMSEKLALAMRWHDKERVNDGVLRHPADSKAWKSFDEKHPTFSYDPRNVRLGLATDGFNPFGNMSLSYSIWPVVLVPYNLPPWMCMKQSFFMISLIIPGPKSPNNDIDVYLGPLVDELKDLWNSGVLTYDASLKSNFSMRAALMWTINDFPAYGSISGWSTKGRLACPSCNFDTSYLWLKHGRKHCYMDHRRFLPVGHRWRKSKAFFGKAEHRLPPKPQSGDCVLDQYSKFDQVIFGKAKGKRKYADMTFGNWRKKSILFELPYWRTHLIRHNLDVMHIEKNICDNVFGTLMGLEGKSKDTLKSRLDLQELRIMKELHPRHVADKYILPVARYTLSMEEKRSLCKFLKDVKFPDGYASNIARCVNVKEAKCIGLKSHDCHVLFQRLLPLALRGLLPKDIFSPIMELSNFFGELCSKVITEEGLDQLQLQVIETLCKFERLFPPAFFDVMVHLSVHLANEAKIAGPVQYRWMYPVERYLRTLKGYVRNKARPEGSIAEGYLAEECMTFCSRYLHDVGTKLDRRDRNCDDEYGSSSKNLSIFSHQGKPIGLGKYEEISMLERDQAHLYVLQNCSEVYPWISEHKFELQQQSTSNVDQRHNKHFIQWFTTKVSKLYEEGNEKVTYELYSLSQCPDRRVNFYGAYCSNGFRFRTKDSERFLKTQNSGVVVKGDDLTGNVDYYGVLTHIIELEYMGGNSVFLFKCDWFEVPSHGKSQTKGYKKDEFGFVSLNFTRLHYTNEPFVLASQVEQVFYVEDNTNKNWRVVLRSKPRNIYDVPYKDPEDNLEHMNDNDPYQLNELAENVSRTRVLASEEDNVLSLTRKDVADKEVDIDINMEQALQQDIDEEILETENDECSSDDNSNNNILEYEDDDWM